MLEFLRFFQNSKNVLKMPVEENSNALNLTGFKKNTSKKRVTMTVQRRHQHAYKRLLKMYRNDQNVIDSF